MDTAAVKKTDFSRLFQLPQGKNNTKPIEIKESTAKSFDFGQHEGLRVWKNNLGAYPNHPKIHETRGSGYPLHEFVYFTDQVPYEDVEIRVLVDEQDLSKLAKLIPNAKKLTMSFCEWSRKYDLSGLKSLLKENGGHLEELHIGEERESSRTRIKNISSLVGKIPIFTFYGQNAKLYKPFTIKNPKFSHIIHIETIKGVVFYHMNDSDVNRELLREMGGPTGDDSCSDITIQVIPDFHYGCDVIFLLVGYEDNGTSQSPIDLKIVPLTKEQWLSLIFQNFTKKERKAMGDFCPRKIEDLEILDDDNVDKLTIDRYNQNFDDVNNKESDDKESDDKDSDEEKKEDPEENIEQEDDDDSDEVTPYPTLYARIQAGSMPIIPQQQQIQPPLQQQIQARPLQQQIQPPLQQQYWGEPR